MASPNSIVPPTQTTAQFTKLNETNYLTWLRQIKPYLHGQKLWGYVSGSILEPKATITVDATDTSPATELPNPAHDEWFTIDQQIVSLLTTSLTDNVSQLTIGFDTSKAIWDCLSRHFSQQSTASAASLKLQLLELQKGSKTVDEYIRHAKSIADALSSIGKPVPEEDLVLSTLHGLGSDYLMLRTTLTQGASLPSFSDLRARILAFDAQRTDSVSSSSVVTALLTQGRDQRDSDRRDFDHKDIDRHTHNRRNQRGRSRGRFYGRGGNYTNPRTPYGSHQPPTHQSSYSPWAGRASWAQGLLGPSPNWCNNCHTSQHDSIRCPHRYSGPTTTPPFAGFQMASDPNWYPDTGATHHMTSSSIPGSVPHSGPHNVYMGNGDSLPISHTGNLPISLGSSKFSLSNVFRVPSLRKNLLSVARFTKDNLVFFLFAPTFYQIYCLLTGRLLFQGPCKDGLYPLSFHSESTVPQALVTIHSSMWHSRLGHPSSSVLSRLGSHLGSKVSFNSFCNVCALSKSHKLPFASNKTFSSSLFEIIHSDVWMSPITSPSGFRYYVLFTDECSRYTWLYPMRRKNEVFPHFKTLVAMIKNIFNGSVKYLQSDNGTEYVNRDFTTYCTSLGIVQRFSCPYTPEQNGLAERKHRHIASMARTLLLTSGVPTTLWVEAVSTSVYLINILPTATLSWNTPHKVLYGHSPSYSSLRVFGCACFPHIESRPSNKLTTQSVECVFIGYSPQHKGYRCLNLKSGQVIISRHVLFDETNFPYKTLQNLKTGSEPSFVEFELRLLTNLKTSSQASIHSPSTSGPNQPTSSSSTDGLQLSTLTPPNPTPPNNHLASPPLNDASSIPSSGDNPPSQISRPPSPPQVIHNVGVKRHIIFCCVLSF
ncbi:unnamed protein product [Rhodiola kirilowii]